MEEKKGADKGIAGRLCMTDREGETKTVIISVKGGHVTSSQVRDLRGVIEREEAAIGVFITLKPAARVEKEVGSALSQSFVKIMTLWSDTKKSVGAAREQSRNLHQRGSFTHGDSTCLMASRRRLGR